MHRPDRVRFTAADLVQLSAAASPWLLFGAGARIPLIGCAAVSLLAGAGLLLSRRERSGMTRARRAAENAILSLAPLAPVDGEHLRDPYGLATDLRALMEESLAQTAALRTILDAIEQPVLALDGEGTIVAANRSSLRVLRQRPETAAIGRPIDQVLPDEQALGVVRSALAGESSRGQTRLLTPEGPRILEIGAERLVDAPGRHTPTVVVVLRDVTEQAAALQLKTDFVANASHELRTPLASIRTAAETLAELGDDSPETRARLVSMIASNADRLEELSRDLLDLSRLESPEARSTPQRVDAQEIARDLTELFEPTCAARRLSLEFDLDPRLRWLWTDGRLLRLVLRNLVDNAVKFAYEGTTVRVRGTVVSGPNPDPGGRADARLEVIDRGVGIPLAQQQRVFERFYQGDAARSGSLPRRGTGLGLAIVKHALRAMGGSVSVKSVWQQGTTMTVDLPGTVEPGPVSA